MSKAIFATMEKEKATEPNMSLLWVWKNQPPVMHWWFGLSAVSILAVYLMLLTEL